ncbi:MAG: lipoyl synthase [Treponema sp.]|jgi:lipoic acid synthetase|nr:lipoyl synthase [Treponema sp.]
MDEGIESSGAVFDPDGARRRVPSAPDIQSPKPFWLKVKLPSGETWKKVEEVLARRRLRTVCDEARCPNKGECWGAGTATFMILGDICTRGCRFCAVATAREGRPVREEEGREIALAAGELGLDYVVLTSVDRDDLPDRGAGHFASCVTALKEAGPGKIKVEALIPDFFGAELERVIGSAPDVIAHNVETVRSLQHIRDSRASFDKSLRTLREARAGLDSLRGGAGKTKSSVLLGLGETREEVLSVMDELRKARTDILVLGQYLRPSKNQAPVEEYVTPDKFENYAEAARERGFSSVIASPLARTSYHAKETESHA